MTPPEDESSTELAWREIVEHYGERAVLPDDEPVTTDRGEERPDAPRDHTDTAPSPASPHPASPAPPSPASPAAGGPSRDFTGELPDDLVDDDPVSAREQAAERVERFRPPTPPPLPRPRTWQRGLAWAGLFVAPVLALLIGLLSLYVNPLVGWALVAWFLGGFGYLVLDMPSSPRDPWDDGSRI